MGYPFAAVSVAGEEANIHISAASSCTLVPYVAGDSLDKHGGSVNLMQTAWRARYVHGSV